MQVGNFRFKGATCKYVTGTGCGMWTVRGWDLPYSVSDVQTCQVGYLGRQVFQSGHQAGAVT